MSDLDDEIESERRLAVGLRQWAAEHYVRGELGMAASLLAAARRAAAKALALSRERSEAA